MKKILIISIFIMIVLFLLCSCSSSVTENINIKEPFTLENGVIKGEVFNKDRISISEYISADGYRIEVFKDEKCLNACSEDSELAYGTNAFYIKFISEKGKKEVLKFEIENTEISGLDFEILNDTVYYPDSIFDYESVKIYGIKKDGSKTVIKEYIADYSFEKANVKIKVCGFELEIPVKVSTDGVIVLDDRLRSSNGLVFALKNEAIYIKSGKEYKGKLSVPENVMYKGKLYPVEGISDYAFENNKNILSVKCTSKMKIGEGAFAGCENLGFAKFCTGCVFSPLTFDGCTNLRSVTLPSDLLIIPNNMFSYCDELASIELPENLEEIGSQAFYECISLESISIPQKVKTVGARAFKYCDNLKTASCGSGVEFIGEGAFSYCANLEILLLPPLSNFEDASVVSGDDNVTVYTGKSSPVLYYLKTDGKKFVTLNDDSIYVINSKTEYSIGSEFDPSSISIIVFGKDEMYITSDFGYKYNFSVPGKTDVTVYVGDKSKTTQVFVEYVIYMYDDISDNGETFIFDYDRNRAYLSSVEDTEEYTIPTKVVYNGIEFDVKGIMKDTFSGLTEIKRLVLGSEIDDIEDGAIHSCPELKLIYISTPIGQMLNIGEDNFTDLSPELIIQTSYGNSIMHNYVRSHNMKYCGLECDGFYVGKVGGGKSVYHPGDSVDKDSFYYIYVDFDLNVHVIDKEEIRLSYDFEKSNVIKFIYNEYSNEYKVTVED